MIGYGLAGRLLPEVIELNQSVRALGRLEQPITYWNAEGALAAIGLVLCARLAGSPSRPLPVRVLAAAGAAPLGMGIYLSDSRGAIAAALVGLVVRSPRRRPGSSCAPRRLHWPRRSPPRSRAGSSNRLRRWPVR